MWPFKTSVRFTEMDFRTDFHSHVLPGVDDGFRSVDKSVEALKRLKDIGLEHQFLTPHIYPELYPDNTPMQIRNVFDSCRAELESTGVACRIAGEHMVYESIEDEFPASDCLSMGQDFLLIEMSYAFESHNIRSFVFDLNTNGFHPVLAHPERYNYYSRSLVELKSIADIDTRFQLNILSLGGFYGNMAKEKAEAILEHGLYTFVGTDLHSLAQIDQLKSLRLQRKHVAAVEKLIENNELLWSGEWSAGNANALPDSGKTKDIKWLA